MLRNIALRLVCLLTMLSFLGACGDDHKEKDEPGKVENFLAKMQGKDLYGPISLPDQNWKGNIQSTTSGNHSISMNLMIPKSEDDKHSRSNNYHKEAFFQLISDSEGEYFGAIGGVTHVNTIRLVRAGVGGALKKRLFIGVDFSYRGNNDIEYNAKLHSFIKATFPDAKNLPLENFSSVTLKLVAEIKKQDNVYKMDGEAYLSYFDESSRHQKHKIGVLALQQNSQSDSCFSVQSESEAKTDKFSYRIKYNDDSSTHFQWKPL